MQKTFSTAQAARKIGVGFRTLNRWLDLGKIRPSIAVPMGGGRTLWRWTDTD
jgi:predicted site-specific integrase-resolvase